MYQNFHPDWRLIWKWVQKLTSQHGLFTVRMKTFFSSLACANKVSCQTLSNYFPNFPWSSFFLGLKSLMEWWRQAWKPTLTDMKIHLGFRAYSLGGQFSKLNISKVVWDIITKFSPVVSLYRYPLCTKYEGSRCLEFGFPAKNVKYF